MVLQGNPQVSVSGIEAGLRTAPRDVAPSVAAQSRRRCHSSSGCRLSRNVDSLASKHRPKRRPPPPNCVHLHVHQVGVRGIMRRQLVQCLAHVPDRRIGFFADEMRIASAALQDTVVLQRTHSGRWRIAMMVTSCI